MSRRHRGYHPKLTNTQIQEKKRLRCNRLNRQSYNRKQRRAFYEEYTQICKKYGCMLGIRYPTVWKVNRNATTYTIKSQLESVEQGLRHEFVVGD